MGFSVNLAFSQGLTAVNGTATDSSGAVMKGVALTVTNIATGSTRSTVTNDVGEYSVTNLLPGHYSIRAGAPNFKTTVADVSLPVDKTIPVNMRLEVGSPATVVNVPVAGETINQTNAQMGRVIDQMQINNLPLNARSIVGLLSLNPGVTIPQKIGESGRDDGGHDNGARNDQQNLVLDRININQQEQGGAMEGAIPTTLESVQEFIVQTAGFDGVAGRSSGAQIQLVTRSGSNEWHGSLYEYYRTTGTSARNYFAPEASKLIRHIPGGSIGGPIIRNKLFIFGNYEHQSDRSATLETRTVPTPEFLNGIVRYRRLDGSLGVLSDGPGGGLEQFSLIPGDRWNSAVIGPNGLFENYRPFSSDTSRTSIGGDGGVNQLFYRFNAPFDKDRNIYISRMDYNFNSKNSVYFRGTLNDDVHTLAAETFPGFNNSRERIDNSKGFAANWNSVVSQILNNSLSFGLTREAFEDTGNRVSSYVPPGFSNLQQTTAASNQAINTWDIVESLSWTKSRHTIEAGANYRYIDNFLRSYNVAGLPTYSGAANVTGNGIGTANSPGLVRALGPAEFATVASPAVVGDAVMAATGSLSRFSENTQFDTHGQRLPGETPFERNFGLQEWDFFLQDTSKLKSNLTLTYGIHFSLQTPPYERNGVQMNWVENLGQRWRDMRDTTRTVDKFTPFSVQLSGRANQVPDFYSMDTNNWAPRLSVAWSPRADSGFLGLLATKGGRMIVRGGYALTYDRIGGRIARDASQMGSIGLVMSILTPASSYSLDGLNSIPRAPRLLPGEPLPRDQFPSISQPNFTVPSTTGGPGGTVTTGIDSGLHSPANHLVNFTISKELPSGWLVEGSYVGRFARDLIGQVDIASPPNVRDSVSGMTWYQATNELFTKYLETGTAVNDVQPIAWYENVYPEIKGFVETKLNRTFASVTQAFYAYMLQQTATGLSLTPGPNAAVSEFDRLNEIERGLGKIKLLNPQVQFFGLFGNFSRSNYNSAQFSARKRLATGFTLSMNYTLSKSMDITSAAEARGNRANGTTGEGLAADPLNPELSYALSDFDRRHQFNSDFLVDLPFGTGHSIGGGASPALNSFIGGWRVSSIVVVASGLPWNFTASDRFNRHFAGRDQPTTIAPIPFELTKQGSSGSIPTVFMIPGTSADRASIAKLDFANSYPGGPVARNQGRGPGYWNADLAVTKVFSLNRIRESSKLLFRWEAFNVFNHPNFSIPSDAGNIAAGGTLGQITTTQGTERVMQFSLRFEF